MTAIVVLGMHRSGTSCLAGMLASARLASAGKAVRNWDNARGHHEMLDVVRLNEAVLAYSGGHWLSAPGEIRWTDAHARARDSLLSARVDGMPALLKDPRTLLTLPFWRASSVSFHVLAIVRHPLAVARSLESWRATPLVEGVALWTAHNSMLALDREHHVYPLIDFEQDRETVVAAVSTACEPFSEVDVDALAAGYDEMLVHHDDAAAPDVPGLAEAIALYERLVARRATSSSRGGSFPHALVARFSERLVASDRDGAMRAAREALTAVRDATAVLVPLVSQMIRARWLAEASELIDEAPGDAALAALLRGKVALASGDAASAVVHLEAACSVARPYFQARHLLPQALRAAGHGTEARGALQAVAQEALYPHGPLSTLAEWSWLDGNRASALTEMRAAIDAAPHHRRGRLRTRLAEWLIACHDTAGARDELARAIVEDPGYTRSRDVLAEHPHMRLHRKR